jgi:ornithine cyclodeaminase/alanine dehydrogenase-like protein (mu-crystallin family)
MPCSEAGGMAMTHAWAIDCVRKIEKLLIYSLDPKEKKEAFIAQLKNKISCEIVIAENAEQAVREADVVTLITSAKDPIIDGDWIKPGTHINGNGSHAPGMREIDSATVVKSKVVCDLVDACKAEAGDFIIPVENGEWNWENLHGSLGDVITNKISKRKNEERNNPLQKRRVGNSGYFNSVNSLQQSQ